MEAEYLITMIGLYGCNNTTNNTAPNKTLQADPES